MAKEQAISKDFNKVLGRLAKEQFPSATLEDVRVDLDEDADGDPILRIVLVFDSATPIDATAAAGFARHLRPSLEGDLFPLIRFITAADFRKQQAATG